jgi:hypothetical protein
MVQGQGRYPGGYPLGAKKGVDAFLSQKDGKIEMHRSYLRVISPTKMLQRLSRKTLSTAPPKLFGLMGKASH